MKISIVGILVLVLIGNVTGEEFLNSPQKENWESVVKVWSGAAELNRYELHQERYGEIRKGESVLVFVREPFLKDRQVKDESGRGNDQVLKMNSVRKFMTGLYPYSTMVSVFQPLEKNSAGEALKVTTSVQEWCGHVFVQMNRRDGVLNTEVRSYFETEEGGKFEERKPVLLEDEIWTALRVDPFGLPVGSVSMIPGSLYLRLSHGVPKPVLAEARWVNGKDEMSAVYEVSYTESGRVLAIEIEKKLPYVILGWHESSGKQLLSSGKLLNRENNIDYWNYADGQKGKRMRAKLGF